MGARRRGEAVGVAWRSHAPCASRRRAPGRPACAVRRARGRVGGRPGDRSGDGRARRRARQRRPGPGVGRGERTRSRRRPPTSRAGSRSRSRPMPGPRCGSRSRARPRAPSPTAGTACTTETPSGSLTFTIEALPPDAVEARDGRRPDRDRRAARQPSPRITPPSTDATAWPGRDPVGCGPRCSCWGRWRWSRPASCRSARAAALARRPDLDPGAAAGHAPDPEVVVQLHEMRSPAGLEAPAIVGAEQRGRVRGGRARPPRRARSRSRRRCGPRCRARSPTRRASSVPAMVARPSCTSTSSVPSRVAPSPVPGDRERIGDEEQAVAGLRAGDDRPQGPCTWLPSAISSTADGVVLERGDGEPRGAMVDAASWR